MSPRFGGGLGWWGSGVRGLMGVPALPPARVWGWFNMQTGVRADRFHGSIRPGPPATFWSFSMKTMADRDGLIWLDGEMVPWREAKTHVLTHTLHYGMGVFEGPRLSRGAGHGDLPSGRAYRPAVPVGAYPGHGDAIQPRRTQRGAAPRCARTISIRPTSARCVSTARGHGPARRQPEGALHGGRLAWGAYLGEEGINNGYPSVCPLSPAIT